jgi:hypothetical protein
MSGFFIGVKIVNDALKTRYCPKKGVFQETFEP